MLVEEGLFHLKEKLNKIQLLCLR